MATIPSGILQGLDMGFVIAMGVIIFGAVCVMIAVLLYMKSFKHKIRIKDVINNNKIIKDDIYKEIKKKDGTTWIRLFKLRKELPQPPSEAVEPNDRGQKVVECYKIGEDEFVYIKDDNQVIPNEILNISDVAERKKKIKEYMDKNSRCISSLQPLTSNNRVILVEQIKQAQTKKSNKWQDYILPITSIAALVILVVCLMIFWGDLAKPILEVENIRNTQLTTQKETLEIIKEIKRDIQIIKDSKDKIPSNAPN